MPNYSVAYCNYRILFLIGSALFFGSGNSLAQLGNGSPYTIQSELTGMCLDMNSGIARQQPCNGSSSQTFTDSGSRVVIQASQECLDVQGISTASGAQIQDFRCHSGNNQKFNLIGASIRPQHSNKCLDIEGGSQSAGARIFQWTCHGGTNQRFRIVNQGDTGGGNNSPSETGQWSAVKSWPLVAVTMANLPDGRILTYSGSERKTWPVNERTYSATWDPETDSFDETLYTGHNMFCGTTSMTEDGKVFVAGGRNRQDSPWTSVYDYETNNWSPLPNMASGGRWYPTTLALGDGNILTAMGVATNVSNPDLWSPDTGWRVLNGINFRSMRERQSRQDIFPMLSQAPNGSIFHFWDSVENHYISTSGSGSSIQANANSDSSSHSTGVQVMYDEGKLLITGANDGSWGDIDSRAFTVDLNGATPVIRATQNMNYQRIFHQMISLPNGEVFVVGGNTTGEKFVDSGSVFQTEIWNPESGDWRLTASISVPRDYHSTALLMTDGRVIVAGGGYHPSDPNSSGT
ncbi:MAG: ricin-type beta-trefoil lectin domain protein, partial [Granulosicoccus sp.]|nr:ricin-type beta-trefoil lectin domain protein [Granulosicoccus sp.]